MFAVGDEIPVELRAFGAAARTTYVETGRAFTTFGSTYTEEMMLTVGEKGRQKVRPCVPVPVDASAMQSSNLLSNASSTHMCLLDAAYLILVYV